MWSRSRIPTSLVRTRDTYRRRNADAMPATTASVDTARRCRARRRPAWLGALLAEIGRHVANDGRRERFTYRLGTTLEAGERYGCGIGGIGGMAGTAGTSGTAGTGGGGGGCGPTQLKPSHHVPVGQSAQLGAGVATVAIAIGANVRPKTTAMAAAERRNIGLISLLREPSPTRLITQSRTPRQVALRGLCARLPGPSRHVQ
jgi:hypothetical protein